MCFFLIYCFLQQKPNHQPRAHHEDSLQVGSESLQEVTRAFSAQPENLLHLLDYLVETLKKFPTGI